MIVRYSGPALTEADAAVGDAGWGGLVFVAASGVSVFLDQTAGCGDGCARTVRLTLSHGPPVRPGALPGSAGATVEVRERGRGPSTPEALPLRRVEIQDGWAGGPWTPGVYSGVAYPETGDPVVFWADGLDSAVE